jgi:hypothetical protein
VLRPGALGGFAVLVPMHLALGTHHNYSYLHRSMMLADRSEA